MQSHDTLFTPTEAAVLTGLPLKTVNNAIDKKTVSAIAGEDAGRPTRLLDARALVSLSLERRLSDRIAPELRRKVFDALAESPRNAGRAMKLNVARVGKSGWRDWNVSRYARAGDLIACRSSAGAHVWQAAPESSDCDS
jgi:hypothetical protein